MIQRIMDCPDHGHCLNEDLIDDLTARIAELEAELAVACHFKAGDRVEFDYAVLDKIAELEAENKRLREAQRWIPVGERLPELYEFVTVRCYNGRISVWRLADGNYDKLCWHNENDIAFAFIRVTHWMPLPEPPKGGDK